MPVILGEFIAVGTGAAIGAWMRWGLSWWLNDWYPRFPLGTLASNLVGGFAVGVALAYFIARSDLPSHYQLFVITGLLGGLTTFSTFSSEVSMLLLRGDYLIGLALATAHLLGSLVLTIIGFAAYRVLAS
ncbi:MAG: fluoride efflux transporter CrcB [Burkholderiales bacterium]|jgi:CrcB protein|nr:fluoride efflux transporter CrcB [Burkholderiales bacterium]